MFTKGTKIHLVGIKGVGMTALAQILVARGCKVTGSDTNEHFFTDAILKRLKIPFQETFSAKNIAGADLVISSGAYYFEKKSLHNAEVSAALTQKIPVLSYPEAIGMLAKKYKVIAVAGSHGKSTTTALLGWVMEQAELNPTVIVGTRVNAWKSNARTPRRYSGQAGGGKYLLVEADEYREAFLNYAPWGAIITSIDYDHPDYFTTKARYYRAFKKLVDTIDKRGWLVGNGDDFEVRHVLTYAQQKKIKTLSYGFTETNDLTLTDEGVFHGKQMFHAVFHPSASSGQAHSTRFTGSRQAREVDSGAIPFPGKHYVANSGAVLGAGHFLKIPLSDSLRAIAKFSGTARRMEAVVKKGARAIIIDDYAHHPTAIRVTLEGIRALYPNRRLVAIFQPHMFSRTQALLADFAKSFSAADAVGIMEIYPSARETSGPVSGKDLAAAVKEHHRKVTFLPTFSQAKKFIAPFLKQEAVIVLMGAGDVNKVIESH